MSQSGRCAHDEFYGNDDEAPEVTSVKETMKQGIIGLFLRHGATIDQQNNPMRRSI